VQMIGDVEPLIEAMQREPWTEFWNHLGLALYHFEDVGLTPTSADLEIWLRCQAEQLVLITDNRNEDSADSLGAAIRTYNTPSSLPVFTIGKLARFQKSNEYAERVVDKLLGYLLDIDRVRGAGRLYLP
jgi:hypothetical protein